MKLLRTFFKLIISVLLWIVLLIPNLIVFLIRILESILKIIKSTLIHLINQVRDEVIK